MTTAQMGALAVPDAGLWAREALLGRSGGLEVDQDVDLSAAAKEALPNDLSREVYCLLGIPVDAVDMTEIVRRIEAAAAGAAPFLISTPNLNFLVNSSNDAEFRESLLLSDLCAADGMPIIWIAKLTGVPIKERVAGSDIFDALTAVREPARRLKLYLFGGPEGAAAAAARALNGEPCGWNCVGLRYPGFGAIDTLSTNEIVDEINASRADFLAVALGAAKGQAWLQRNHHCLRIPVRAHLGATVNFLSGRVKRAPLWMRSCGLEWLWRIKEEPCLWTRYAKDGAALLGLLVTHVLPLAILRWRDRLHLKRAPQSLKIGVSQIDGDVALRLSGTATKPHIEKAISCFAGAVASRSRAVIVDMSGLCAVDARFLGLLFMLRKQLKGQGRDLILTGASRRLKTVFRLNGAGFLLSKH
jgi:N-acetylglucosaminyldiphosphoundecaprenol N-acetyl-beta-D-mannosaminyltransferase